MLSDHEREALRELERQFTVEADAAPPLPPHHVDRQQFGASSTLMIGTVLSLGMIMLMAGSPAGAVMFGAMAWLIWWARLPSSDDTTDDTTGPP